MIEEPKTDPVVSHKADFGAVPKVVKGREDVIALVGSSSFIARPGLSLFMFISIISVLFRAYLRKPEDLVCLVPLDLPFRSVARKDDGRDVAQL